MNIKNWSETQRFIKYMNGKTKFTLSKISDEIGFSRQTFHNKLDNLRDRKIITNFTININPNIHPINLKYVILEIKTNPKEPELVEKLLIIPQLRMLDGIFGDFSLVALFIFKSSEEYYQILNTIDTIMAKSYFKKYQIIETIRVFKTNGISLRNSILSTEGELVDHLDKFNKNRKKESNLKNIYGLDDMDYRILTILQDCQGLKPISTYDIKNIFYKRFKLEVSQSTIHNRIKNLEQQRVILSYTVNFNPKKVGFKGKYLLRIKPKDPSKYNELAISLEANMNITYLFRIGEEYGLFAIVRVKKIEDYGDFIRELYLTEEIEDTYTNFVLDELKSNTNFIIF
ncbi:MAG: putative HTH-type transcriptional regulator [Candidatus Lokiarchaeum sp. GC14_75]|nr:MAG: putative HTH-type transcriptional regulator [Candidatus Lokiarchaeum sp. GC14_75]